MFLLLTHKYNETPCRNPLLCKRFYCPTRNMLFWVFDIRCKSKRCINSLDTYVAQNVIYSCFSDLNPPSSCHHIIILLFQSQTRSKIAKPKSLLIHIWLRIFYVLCLWSSLPKENNGSSHKKTISLKCFLFPGVVCNLLNTKWNDTDVFVSRSRKGCCCWVSHLCA